MASLVDILQIVCDVFTSRKFVNSSLVMFFIKYVILSFKSFMISTAANISPA